MKKTPEVIIFNIVSYIIVGGFAIACIMPFLYTLSGSFTKEALLYEGLRLIPKEFSIEAYDLIFKRYDEMLNAYGVTIILVIIGTSLGVLLITMTAYVLYRNDFKYKNIFSFYFVFTILFSGGLVPLYILVSNLGIRNTFFALLLPELHLVNVFHIIITRTFLQSSVPNSLIESAKIDGGGDFMIYRRIVLPVSKPIIATICLLIAIVYWNNWRNAMLYITEAKLYPLQYYLYNIYHSMQWRQLLQEHTAVSLGPTPKEGYKLAMTIFTIGPVILFYPFVQKYLIQGMTIGAVKG